MEPEKGTRDNVIGHRRSTICMPDNEDKNVDTHM